MLSAQCQGLRPEVASLPAHPDEAGEDRSDERGSEENEHAARNPPEADVELRVPQVLAGHHLPVQRHEVSILRNEHVWKGMGLGLGVGSGSRSEWRLGS